MHSHHTFLAPAKINLFLHITGRRPDGYHTLQSVFQLLDFYDTLHLSVRQDGQIVRQSELANVPAEQDLCVRAARALQDATHCKLGVDISVEKHIPMGGGLGGGSSDAATTLLALNQLWSLHLNRQTLMQIGVRLGADVPFFLFGQTAWAEGIGEELTPVSVPNTTDEETYLVLTPQVNVVTAQIFANSRLTRDTKPLKIADFSSQANSKLFRNDLENVVCEEFPSVATTLQWLNQFGEARMSGSGASVFVKVNSTQVAAELLAKKPTNTNGFIAKGLNYHPHFKLAD
ncbi:4-(cytidine 5'-diphospho)-2-C-methyl-D-erythritol kinase [Methylotenera sp. 1P/1]|uniref:4-(cytidine 5'-diphospho)-2-C-methyl-D-erythritol kinase n=1 Tax=Methylotenera sp. 1P/1 TaxID=1131551 RepID=UPI00037CDAAD|nr:4-(cytidine 5'-diphospho)-2-C-methyl-D-erythritol kinase [Methylotenera sp. 1P/1]